MTKISLIGQIAEVQREIAKRHEVYPRLAASGKMKHAEGELLIGRMEAVLASLKFLQKHEADIRTMIAAKREVK